MIHNILHISDIHFSSDDDSYLRDNQDDFLFELVNEIKSVESSVDYLFLTGDYVERSTWDGGSVVSALINKLEAALEIKQTFCVNGNHDLNNEGFSAEGYHMFRSTLKVIKPTFETDFFRATLLSENHWVFEFDCFSNGKREVNLKHEGVYKPLKDSQLKFFESFLIDYLLDSKQNIYLLSHLPVQVNPNSPLFDDLQWNDRHIWKDGHNILELITKHINVNLLLWFAGDGHVVESYKVPDLPYFYFLTGRFNGPIEKYGQYRERETAKEASCQFLRVDSVKSKVVRSIQFSTFQERYEQESFKWYSKSTDFINSTKFLNKFFSGSSKQEFINREITKSIGENKLYELVKATTKQKNISIGWIDINGLINQDNILKQFLECTSELLDMEYVDGYEDMIILGLGYWGSSIASFISLNKNIPMFSLKVRGCNLNEYSSLRKVIENKNIIIASDVVSSGETLDELREVLNIRDFSCLISVILNPLISDGLRGVDRIIYGSNQIALPILEREYLPDSIINSKYDFDKI